ncbi:MULTISPECIES: hypothetical protein [Chloroflexus]|jgi:hypothetical protein|uniref:hypothetical protein n=1 Tax=Chloroflexus TaxID=1107 RepID=UPI0012FE9C8A|nr:MULTISPECIES: hypothetical protein [Chloroflexus]
MAHKDFAAHFFAAVMEYSTGFGLCQTLWIGLEPISKNIYEKVSSSLPLDSMFMTSKPGLRVTSRVNDVTRAGSCVRLARQHGCRTPNYATRG